MKNISIYLIPPSSTIKEAARSIDLNEAQIALVVDEDRRLLGTVTDGDIRRALLNQIGIENSVECIMRREFSSLPLDASENQALTLMRKNLIRQIPVLDEDGRVIRLFRLEELLHYQHLKNWVVLMAGGKGERLGELTENCPKPMLLVDGRPMLEILLEKCIEIGFRTIFISVNYLKEQIIDYFGNGQRWNIDISYIEEKQPLGTAGALSLLPKNPEHPVLIVNSDVMTRANLSHLIQFHEGNEASATVCIREHETQIPYGVVQTRGNIVQSFEEKPILKHYVNAGIYLLNPEVIRLLNLNQPCDMPSLLERALVQKMSVNAFPIHEYWRDVGHLDSLKQVNGDWHNL